MSTLGILRNRDPAPDTPPRPVKKRRFSLLVVILVALLIPSAAVYLLTGRSSDTEAVLTYSAPGPETTAAAPAGRCNYPAKPSNDVSAIVPPDVRWELTAGTTMAAPRSGEAGPLKIDGNITSCYARTPSGALLATTNLVAELSNGTLDMDRLVATKVTNTTGYDALQQRVQSWEASVTSRPAQPVQQIAGYRFLQFTTRWAVIEIVLRNTSGELAGAMATVSYAVAWDDDDWKLVPPIDGGNVPSQRLESLEFPYIPFGGA